MLNTFPQCGRASSPSSAASTASTTGSTAASSEIQVKCRAALSRPYAAESHCSSAATERTSATCSTGAMRSRIASSARSAGTTVSRGTRYSDCSSSPLLGVKSSRKCGSRVNHGPVEPSCGVQDVGSTPRTMCRGPSAGVVPSHPAGSGGSSARCFTQTCSNPSPRSR